MDDSDIPDLEDDRVEDLGDRLARLRLPVPAAVAEPGYRQRAEEMSARLTGARAGGSNGRRIAELRCPVGRGLIAGLYAIDGEVWLWHEGFRGRSGGHLPPVYPDGSPRRPRAHPPHAILIREDRELPHPRPCKCGRRMFRSLTCRCCRRDSLLVCRCDDLLHVVPFPRRG